LSRLKHKPPHDLTATFLLDDFVGKESVFAMRDVADAGYASRRDRVGASPAIGKQKIGPEDLQRSR
jgi:hypothetical protein